MTSQGTDTWAIDLLCAGRAGVDLYAEQEMAPLRGVQSFAKYVGGSAANICVGAARLGLRTAMCTRVGDEDLGRYVVETLRREGVGTSLVQLDPVRPTGLVQLAMRQSDDFPRIFFYRDSADLALDPEALDWATASRSRAVLLTGTYLSSKQLRAISLRLAQAVREAGGKVVLDIDYRPVLWGVVPVGRGNDMSSTVPEVAAAYRDILPLCDLIVGTRDEILVASGTSELKDALVALRAVTPATIVVKQGSRGAAVYDGPVGEGFADPAGRADPAGISAPAYSVEVVNSVGAGDAFMSGFLSGWLTDQPLERCVLLGNASGALVTARHGCMPAMPFTDERDSFVRRGGVQRPDMDGEIERMHRVGARAPTPEQLCVLAIDHRWQLEELALSCGVGRDRIIELKRLLGEAFFFVAATRDDVGILVDHDYGYEVLEAATGTGRFVACAMDVARSRPVELSVGEDIYEGLRRWTPDAVVKVMTYAHPDDPPELAETQAARLARLSRACRSLGRELLVELQVPHAMTFGPKDVPVLVRMLYEAGARPEWWKLPPVADGAVWAQVGDVVRDHDPSCRGLLVLGSTSTNVQLEAAFRAASHEPLCRGFAVGRAIFASSAEAWFRGDISGAELSGAVAARYRETIERWEMVRSEAG